MGDIHYIVDKLNATPFQYNLTLLSFRCALLVHQPAVFLYDPLLLLLLLLLLF